MNNAELNAGVNHSRNCTMLDRDPTKKEKIRRGATLMQPLTMYHLV